MNTPQEDCGRVKQFMRNDSLEELLSDLNDSLFCAEKSMLRKISFSEVDYPIVFLMGPHRSGSTLFLQWLANTGLVAYPTNLLSRFYAAPVIGAKIQLMLTDSRYNFRDEILDFNSPILFDSENGKTKGALAPNEFWYFWRRFLPFRELDWLPDEELFHLVDQNKLVGELMALTQVFDKPFALKSMILNYNIPFLNEIFKKALFIQLKRDPVANVASILEARKRQFGDEDIWYSFKIPEYPHLINLDPITQTAGQLHYINSAVTKGIESVNESRKFVLQYEDFCQNPQQVYIDLVKKLGLSGNEFSYCGPKQFTASRNTVVQNGKIIEKALFNFSTI